MANYILYEEQPDTELFEIFNRTETPYTAFDMTAWTPELFETLLKEGNRFFISTALGQNPQRWLVMVAFLAGYSYANKVETFFLGTLPTFITPHKSLVSLENANDLHQFLVEKKESLAKIIQLKGENFFDEVLMASVIKGNTAKVARLLEGYCSPNGCDDKGNSALILAIRYQHKELIHLLLDKGANCNSANNTGNTPLIEAAAKGDSTTVSLLLQKGCNPNTVNGQGQSALILAVCDGNEEIVTKLLTLAEINLEVVDNLGLNALQYADLFRHQNLSQLLKNRISHFEN